MLLPASEDDPAGHSSQLIEVIEVLRYRPILHGSHAPFVPVPASPASQLKQLALPASDFSPTPQSLQEDDPGNFENVLAAQSTHSVLPTAVLNLPGMQGKHAADALFGWYLPDGQSKPSILLLFKLKETEMEKVKNLLFEYNN